MKGFFFTKKMMEGIWQELYYLGKTLKKIKAKFKISTKME